MFSKGKVTNLKAPVFFSEKKKNIYIYIYIYPQPPAPLLFGVFLEQLNTHKEGRECLACPPPGYQDQVYLVWFSPDILYTVIS